MRNLVVVFVVALVAFSCNQSQKVSENEVQSLFSNVELKGFSHIYSSNKDQLINLETGV